MAFASVPLEARALGWRFLRRRDALTAVARPVVLDGSPLVDVAALAARVTARTARFARSTAASLSRPPRALEGRFTTRFGADLDDGRFFTPEVDDGRFVAVDVSWDGRAMDESGRHAVRLYPVPRQCCPRLQFWQSVAAFAVVLAHRAPSSREATLTVRRPAGTPLRASPRPTGPGDGLAQERTTAGARVYPVAVVAAAAARSTSTSHAPTTSVRSLARRATSSRTWDYSPCQGT